MASGKSVQASIKRTLKRVQATTRTVSLRQVAVTGGNALLGINQNAVNTDTVCDPQPSVQDLQQDEITSSGGRFIAGDLRLIFAGDIPEATLNASLILYGSDILKIITKTPSPIFGVNAAWNVIARSMTAE